MAPRLLHLVVVQLQPRQGGMGAGRLSHLDPWAMRLGGLHGENLVLGNFPADFL